MLFSKLKICDNTNVKKVKCIKIQKKSKFFLGSLLKVVIINVKNKTKISKGSLFKSVFVRQNFWFNRKTGNFLSFDKNEALLLNNK
jgi:ribosomal protein L14